MEVELTGPLTLACSGKDQVYNEGPVTVVIHGVPSVLGNPQISSILELRKWLHRVQRKQ